MKHAHTLHALVLGLVLAGPAWGQVTRRISVATGGGQSSAPSFTPSISGDGLLVAFDSQATNFYGGDTEGDWDVFVRKWANDRTELMSIDPSAMAGNATSQLPAISSDGDWVAFQSDATNLVSGDTNNRSDIFVRSRLLDTTQRVSVSSGGVEADNDSLQASISADGRYVAFSSIATNLVTGDTNGVTDIFLRDRLSVVTERISVSSTGVQGNGASTAPSISGDGRYVAFASTATNLMTGDTNGVADIFVRDRLNGTTVLASRNNGASFSQANGASANPSISADGRFVAFDSIANNLIDPLASDTNGRKDVFVRNHVDGGTSLVSFSSSFAQGNGDSANPSISADGRFVAFQSHASNLVSGDSNGDEDVFVRDRTAFTTQRVSVHSNGAQGDQESKSPSISGDGRFVAYMSHATNLVSGDSNDDPDIFLTDRVPSGFTSVCDPGVGGVIACPCGNPPTAAGRGCNNSSSTGGAFLSAAGAAYLSADSLVFTTGAEKPTALSILLQGDGVIAAGAVYGQGVRCVGGVLKRLFVKTANTGSITAPGPGDPTVSAQSAAKGDTILPAESRWYLVYYRDGQILGSCPSSATFNATQTGRVTWMP